MATGATTTTTTTATATEMTKTKAKAAKPQAGSAPVVVSCTELLAEARKVCIRLVDVNEHFVCILCNGYLRDAQKINECAHTFCKGCIRAYFWYKDNNKCPKCFTHLGAKPWTKLTDDPTIQGLADKIIPDSRKKEEEDARKFYARLGIKRKRHDADDGGSASTSKKTASTTMDAVDHSSTVETVISEPGKLSPSMPPALHFEMHPLRSPDMPLFLYMSDLKQPRMKTDPTTRIVTLCKYLTRKLALSDGEEVMMLCRGEPVGPEYSVAFVHRAIWRDKAKMILQYRRNVIRDDVLRKGSRDS